MLGDTYKQPGSCLQAGKDSRCGIFKNDTLRDIET